MGDSQSPGSRFEPGRPHQMTLLPKDRTLGYEPGRCGSSPHGSTNLTHVWRVRKFLPERFGQMCRPLRYGRRMNSVLVEFADGYRVVSLRWFIRRVS